MRSLIIALALIVIGCASAPRTNSTTQNTTIGYTTAPTALAPGLNHNFDIGEYTILLLVPDAAGSTITGLDIITASRGDGEIMLLRNQHESRSLVIAHDHPGSQPRNRFKTHDGRDVVLGPWQSVWLEWDDRNGRWFVLADNSIRGVASTSTPTRALGTAFCPNATRPVLGSYTVRIDSSLTITGGQRGRIELLSDAADPPTTIRSRISGGSNGTLTIGLNVADTVEAPLTYLVPPGHCVLLRSVNEVGSPSYSIVSQVEQVL